MKSSSCSPSSLVLDLIIMFEAEDENAIVKVK